MLAGWGWFNIVEGLIDHLILGVHRVRPGSSEIAYDISFLALGVVLVGVGTLMGRHSVAQPYGRPR